MSSKLLKNSIIYAVGDIIPRVIIFLIFPVLTTHLSPADYGIVNYVNMFITLFAIVSILGLNTYYLVHYFKVGDVVAQRKLLGNITQFVVGINLILTILLLLLGYIAPTAFSSNIDFFPYIALGVGTNFFNVFSILPSALYRVQERPLPLATINIIKGIVTMGLTLTLVVGFGFSAKGVLWANFVVSLLFALIFIAITLRNMEFNLNWPQIKSALRFSMPLVPGAIAYFALSMSDRYFIDKYLSLTELGIYTTASTLAMILSIVSYGAYRAFEPYFFKIYGSETFTRQYKNIQNLYLFVILFGGAGLSIYAREFFELFASSSYSMVYLYVPMVQVSVIFMAMSLLFATIVTAQGKTKINALANIIGGGLSIALNILLIPRFGIVASCIASSVATATIMIILFRSARLGVSYVAPIAAFLLTATSVALCVYTIDFDGTLYDILFKSAVLIITMIVNLLILKIDVRKYIFRHTATNITRQ